MCERCVGEDYVCDEVGRCEAPEPPMSGAGITSCIHCGKELREKDGEWYTWDAENVPDPQPQLYRD